MTGGRLLATYFGMYAVVQGIGAALGNVAGGAVLDLGQASGSAGLPWALMVSVGLTCAASLTILDRTGQLRPAGARRESTTILPRDPLPVS